VLFFSVADMRRRLQGIRRHLSRRLCVKTLLASNGTTMKIRPYQTSDLDQVIALWHACDLIIAANDPRKDIQRKLAVSPELFLLGELKGEVVASVMAGYEGHRGWINYLAVDPNHRRNSYGRLMMAAAEQLLDELGCPKINLQVRSANGAVVAFYESLGFSTDEVVSMGKRLRID